ncbi:hypothetical protein ONZ51_g7507 [Trametes cubensis]|uniref:C2H2-type domain-containing protein n=1 Tax=Trametes cubensis TaxID=1111947 RepID=A0AAD7TPY6_9APHY|nr:hypothetical protein ONZ51_g7507 [Trametes cubensis]
MPQSISSKKKDMQSYHPTASGGYPQTLTLPMSVPVSVPVSLPISLPASFKPTSPVLPVDQPPFQTQQLHAQPEHYAHSFATTPLSLEDICHLEPTSDTTQVTGVAGSSFTVVNDTTEEQPYSDCPATEFSTPSWAMPPTLLSSQYDSTSGSGAGLTASPKKEPLDDIIRFSPISGSTDTNALGPAPLLGIYVDCNLRQQALQEQGPSICVNPADIMGSRSGLDSDDTTQRDLDSRISPLDATASQPTSQAQAPLTSREPPLASGSLVDYAGEALAQNDFPEEAITAIVSVLKSSAKQETPDSRVQQPPSEICKVIAPQPLYPSQITTFPVSDPRLHHPSLASTNCHVTLTGQRMPLADLPIPQEQQIVYPEYGSFASLQVTQAVPQPIVLPPPPSPVLNAHTGIELEELRRRANDFRMRNPGTELDRSFLQSFAGRLSTRGELLDDYRCYVVGCGQRNRRRDHILVHVGSHVEHRPWQCQHCGMRFLRKNECKRHESSHGGRKPFSCPICAPFTERNFVRQDLLKRHMRVTHGVQDSSRASSSKKRAEVKKDEDAEYWP